VPFNTPVIERAVQRGGAVRPAEPRGAEGGARFSCPKDITGSAFLVCVYEGTGEASVVYRASGEHDSMHSLEEKDLAKIAPYVDAEGVLNESLFASDSLAKQLDNLRRANARAVKNLRQFMVRWSLTKLWTFTVSPRAKIDRYSKEQVQGAMNDFFQRWRVLNGGHAFPYVYVLEQHRDGAWHVHVAVPNDLFTDYYALRRVWGHGRIQFDKAKRHAKEARNDSRRLALYLVKYIAKEIGEDHRPGEHRYERAEGFAVAVTRRYFSTMAEVRLFLSERVEGEKFREVWSDYEVENWRGPPTWLFMSDGAT
jgi:hypothetical protein